MLIKKKLVLRWNIDDAKNDGYLLAGSFPLSLGNDIEFKEIKKNKTPIVFILGDKGIIAKSRDKYPGELNSITKDSKFVSIFNEIKTNSNLDFISEYIGFSTLYSNFKLTSGNRNNSNIRIGVIIELYSSNLDNIYILQIKSDNSNEWRKYQTKPIEIKDLVINEETELNDYIKLSEKELLDKIKSKSTENNVILSQVKRYSRNLYIVAYALNRAKGICELCKKEAPFIKEDGSPYLEVHHIIPLSENGSDSLENVIAICPNCHRELHFGNNRTIIKEKLIKN